MRLLFLNSAADAALLWRPHAELIRDDKERVNLVCDIRSAYYKLEAEAKYSLNHAVRDFKFPKSYHLIAEFTKALMRPRDTPEGTASTAGASSATSNASATPTAVPVSATASAPPSTAVPGPNVPTEPAADRNQICFLGNRRARGSRTKTPKFVPEGADDSDVEISIPTEVTTIASGPKDPAVVMDDDVVMSEPSAAEAASTGDSASEAMAPTSSTASALAVTPSEPKAHRSGSRASSSKSSSSLTPAKAEVCFISYAEVPGLDLTSPSFIKLKSLPSFRSSGLGKRARLDDSASLGARNAVADLEAELKYLDVRISVLARTRDHLRALIDAL
ncbi:hypothetical protein CVT24_010957 [Panaeolus cyanescens]|uniref:Uncharacterized protein n=1 Tax=Panaeolus cyanescens TaxID=181874 RepID=A0A409YVU5_9AGAR|nr:hypothetical protein CVT24_010957 [Panaeolus cyanescens]